MAHAHPIPPPAASWRGQLGLAALMAWAAGFVDAFGYLFLARVFTAHQSGNTARSGLFLSAGRWRHVAWYGWPIAMFVAGMLGGAAIMEHSRRNRYQGARLLLILEIVLLAGFLAAAAALTRGHVLDVRGGLRWAVVALPALAMGLQTIAVTRVGDIPIATTYFTGALNTFSEGTVQYLYSLRALDAAGRRAGHARLRHAFIAAGIWAAFFAGVIAGAAGKPAWGAKALLLPIAALAVVLAFSAFARE